MSAKGEGGRCCGASASAPPLLENVCRCLHASVTNPTHCLHLLLSSTRSSQHTEVWDRGHSYTLPTLYITAVQNSFIKWCLFRYTIWCFCAFLSVASTCMYYHISLPFYFTICCMRLSHANTKILMRTNRHANLLIVHVLYRLKQQQ